MCGNGLSKPSSRSSSQREGDRASWGQVLGTGRAVCAIGLPTFAEFRPKWLPDVFERWQVRSASSAAPARHSWGREATRDRRAGRTPRQPPSPLHLFRQAVARQPQGEQEAPERGRGVDDRESVILGRLHPAAPGRLRVIPVGPALRLLELVSATVPPSASHACTAVDSAACVRCAPGRQGCLGR
jgi:hypothetical protein